MRRKDRIPPEIKTKHVEEYLAGKLGQHEAARKCGVNPRTFEIWVAKYKAEGSKGLHVQKENKKYQGWLKKEAVEEYLRGGCLLVAICGKYAISSPHTLSNWIKEYNAHGRLKSDSGGSRMSKTRKTGNRQGLHSAWKELWEGRDQIFRFLSECISVGS